ncbi:312_t:CDS:2 [Cetraspora pellucida]|uniref:312_t:CDS:1 n=1 Tax=Cetraspora pellucida TaxID=1433469 RepID=A0ACA9LP15_9GLOM|nr:312_t:CDS:2 [Cetraspora pellucida]
MTQVKILTKLKSRYELVDGIRAFNIFVTKETVMEEITDRYTGRKETKEVPKWEILIDPDHPKMKELVKSVIDLDHKEYSYEISFVDDGSVLDKNKRKRIFLEEKSNVYIDIKDKLYSEKIKELKKLNNLIPGEEKGKKFIDELETELNKKTERERDENEELTIEQLEEKLRRKQLEEKLKEKHRDSSILGVCQTCHVPIYHGEAIYTPRDYATEGS